MSMEKFDGIIKFLELMESLYSGFISTEVCLGVRPSPPFLCPSLSPEREVQLLAFIPSLPDNVLLPPGVEVSDPRSSFHSPPPREEGLAIKRGSFSELVAFLLGSLILSYISLCVFLLRASVFSDLLIAFH